MTRGLSKLGYFKSVDGVVDKLDSFLMGEDYSRESISYFDINQL
jgi:hypothetical protein